MVMNKSWAKNGFKGLQDMERAQNEMDHANERKIKKFMKKNGKTIEDDMKAITKSWEGQAFPIVRKLQKKT